MYTTFIYFSFSIFEQNFLKFSGEIISANCKKKILHKLFKLPFDRRGMISIIGAGPSGNYLAFLLAKQSHDVHVYEDHKVIGTPVQCTGIITPELEKIIPVKKSFLTNKINQAQIYAPNGSSLHVRFKKDDIIVDRTLFDSHLASLAEKAGAQYHLGQRFIENKGKKMKIGEKFIETDILIGADGPFSRVAKTNGMWCDRKFVTGNQVTVEVDCEPKLVEFWLGIGLFGWLVPENDSVARVGIISYDQPDIYLKKLLDKRCPSAKVLHREPGAIPIYNPKQILQKDFVYLIGDAATQVKATSYGGIVHGMKAAQILARDMQHYQKNCRKEVGRDLYLSLLIRKAMDRFSEKDYNALVELFTQEKLKRVLETKSRDYPTKFLLDLILVEPRLLAFTRKFLF